MPGFQRSEFQVKVQSYKQCNRMVNKFLLNYFDQLPHTILSFYCSKQATITANGDTILYAIL